LATPERRPGSRKTLTHSLPVLLKVPNNQYPSHLIGYRVDIEPDTQLNVSVDYALDENGNVMVHP
jgi:hypothetical protein